MVFYKNVSRVVPHGTITPTTSAARITVTFLSVFVSAMAESQIIEINRRLPYKVNNFFNWVLYLWAWRPRL